VGRGGALGALDRGWEAAAAAVDGEQKLRRRSGEVESSGKERGEQNGRVQVQEQVHEELQVVLGVQKKARSRGSSCWQPAGGVASRGDGGAMWRCREGSSAVWGTAARPLGRHVAQRRAARDSRCTAHGRRRRQRSGAENTERERTGGRRRGTDLLFSKSAGTPL
jgi:hypothetical protein